MVKMKKVRNDIDRTNADEHKVYLSDSIAYITT